ncbi:MAG TPA: methyltransferase domain-containing protein [Pseudonocardiaceae bacterium]|nr:methyltransferase domain-containing protein [Pseudonocardiaceae bacterium]
MSAELDGVRNVWERLGTDDPYWAVLTEDDFRGGNARAEFFEKGRQEVRHALDVLDRHGKPYGDVAVDFGCGVGRLTYALGEHFGSVTGVDVAESMIEEANANNPVPERVRFVHNASTTLPFDDDSVDLVFSLITMQHMPPSLSIRYLLDMVRVTRPGGHLMFQLPSHLPKPSALPRSRCRAGISVVTVPAEMRCGDPCHVTVSVRNDGDGPWPEFQLINVANHWYSDGAPVRWDDARMAVPPLASGESAELTLRVEAPEQPGAYELEFDVVQETVAWWAQLGSTPVRHPVEVVAPAAPVVVEAPPAAEPVEPAAPVGTMQMHGVRMDLVRSLLAHLGCTVLEAERDDRAGYGWQSFFYVVEVGEYHFEPS